MLCALYIVLQEAVSIISELLYVCTNVFCVCAYMNFNTPLLHHIMHITFNILKHVYFLSHNGRLTHLQSFAYSPSPCSGSTRVSH